MAVPRLQQALGLVNRLGFGKQIALKQVAAVGAQKGVLRWGLNPFGNHLQPQRAPHGDDGLHNGRIVAVVGNVAHKALLDFELIQRQALEVLTRQSNTPNHAA